MHKKKMTTVAGLLLAPDALAVMARPSFAMYCYAEEQDDEGTIYTHCVDGNDTIEVSRTAEGDVEVTRYCGSGSGIGCVDE